MDPSSPATETNFKSREQKPPATTHFEFRTELEAVSSQVENFDSSIKIPTLFDLNNCVKNIDSEDSLDKFLRKFLWFYMNDVGLNREETIISQLSLLDYLTRYRGRFLIPRITTTIVKVLLELLSSNSNPSLTSQIYCSRVISSMVNSMAGANWQDSQHAVAVVSCVLIQFLLGKGKFSSVASAILLRALVGTEAWKYASDDIVNKVYFKIAILLKKKETQTPFHLNLLCCLIKKNGHIASSYVRSMLSCAKKILLTGSDHERRFCAVQMINCILKYADVNVMSPRFLKCMRIIKWRHGFDQCPAIRDVCAETIEEFKFSTSLLGLTLAEGLSVEQGEDHGSCSVSAIRTWVSSYPVFDPHVCIDDCCLRLDTRKSNSLFASKSNTPKVPPAEAQISTRTEGIQSVLH